MLYVNRNLLSSPNIFERNFKVKESTMEFVLLLALVAFTPAFAQEIPDEPLICVFEK